MKINKIDRIGEKRINNFGSEMIIINSYTEFNGKHNRNYTYIDVYFPQYNWTFKRAKYDSFKKGNIKCPYEPRVFGIGYIGEGEYKRWENGRNTRAYDTWNNMLGRCYDEKCQEKNPTYIDCEVCEEWHDFQAFAEWYYKNYYEIKGEQMCLDKDILLKGNKIYSPETCIFVPKRINSLFIKCDSKRGNNPVGVFDCENGKYQVSFSIYDFKTCKSKSEYLGRYDTQEKAFEVYKQFKERNIKEFADYYEGRIPEKLYNGLYNYDVEITD